MRFCSFLLLIIMLFCGILGTAESMPEIYQAPKQITITFTGDCTLGCDPKERGKETSFESYIEKYGYEYPFANVKSLFEQDDLTVINLEGTLYDSDEGIVKKTYNFRGPADYAKILSLSSIEAVSIGNNHTMDYGKAGFSSTVAALEENNIAWFGTTECSDRSWIYEKDGVKIGFVSINISYWWREGNGLKMKQMLADLKSSGCGLIIACIHSGVEYKVRHDSNQEKMADAFFKNGADIVICNHPHIIQGMRVEKGKTALWSLGNFSFGGNSQIRALAAYIAQFTFSFDENNQYLGHQLNILPVHVSGHSDYNDYQPVLVNGKEAKEAVDAIRIDSVPRKNVLPYIENVGALQAFVPAPR